MMIGPMIQNGTVAFSYSVRSTSLHLHIGVQSNRTYVAEKKLKIIFDCFDTKNDVFSIFPTIYRSRLVLGKKSGVNPTSQSFI